MFGGGDCWPTYGVLVSMVRFSNYLNYSYLSNHFWVITPLELSELYPVTVGGPSFIYPPTSYCVEIFFDCRIRTWPYFVKNYISDKSDRVTAASQLNEGLEAISQFGKTWQISLPWINFFHYWFHYNMTFYQTHILHWLWIIQLFLNLILSKFYGLNLILYLPGNHR